MTEDCPKRVQEEFDMLEKFSTTGEESEMYAQDQAISKQLHKILLSQSKGDTYLNEMRLEEIDEDEDEAEGRKGESRGS